MSLLSSLQFRSGPRPHSRSRTPFLACLFPLISFLPQKRRHFCATSHHALFLVLWSLQQEGLRCFLHCVHEEVSNRVRRRRDGGTPPAFPEALHREPVSLLVSSSHASGTRFVASTDHARSISCFFLTIDPFGRDRFFLTGL